MSTEAEGRAAKPGDSQRSCERAVITSARENQPGHSGPMVLPATELTSLQKHLSHLHPEGSAPRRDVRLGSLHVSLPSTHKSTNGHRKLHSACSFLVHDPYAKLSPPNRLPT